MAEEITDEMVDAGVGAYRAFDWRIGQADVMVMEVFDAMRRAVRTSRHTSDRDR